MAELGDLNPKFWYVDDAGKIKKLIYCKLCHAGPFKEFQKKTCFNFFGMGEKDPYCISCATALGNFQNTPVKSHKKVEEIKGGRKQTPQNPFESTEEEPTREQPESDTPEWD